MCDCEDNIQTGLDGNNAYTKLTAAFTMPAEGANGTAYINSDRPLTNEWCNIGQKVNILGSTLEVISKSTGSIVLKNLANTSTGEYLENAAPATIFPSQSGVSPGGDQGPQGIPTATIEVGTVTTVPFGDPATVTNSGTTQAVILDFEIPEGEPGAIVKILDETSPDAQSDTTGATINNHSWTTLELTSDQDTISFEFTIQPFSGNGNFSSVDVNVGGTVISSFTDSDATIAAQIKYNTDPTDVPAGYTSSSNVSLSEDITLIKGVAKITRRTNTSITYDITYYMYNNYVQEQYATGSNTRMVQKIFHTTGGHSVTSIDASGITFELSVTPNFMASGATFGTDIQIYNAIKYSSAV